MSFTDEQRQKAIDTRRANAEAKRRAMDEAGVPDSKPFAAEHPDKQAWLQKMRGCHMNGKPLADWSEDHLSTLRYEWTDEGIAEANQGKAEPSGIRITKDEFTKALEHRTDAVKEQGMEVWEAPNPLKEVADRHKRPGMAQKFLSPEKIDKDGMRGYEPVIDPKTGQQVKVRNMILGEMPLSKREARNKFYRDKANEAIAQVERTYKQEGGPTSAGEISQR